MLYSDPIQGIDCPQKLIFFCTACGGDGVKLPARDFVIATETNDLSIAHSFVGAQILAGLVTEVVYKIVRKNTIAGVTKANRLVLPSLADHVPKFV